MLALIASIRIAAKGTNDGVANGWPNEGAVPNLKLLTVTTWAMRDNTLRGGPYTMATASAAVGALVKDTAKRTPHVVENTVESDEPFVAPAPLTFHGSF